MWVVAARAASVVCDPGEARRILEDARIDEARAPVTHPWLVPGLARGAGDPAVADAIRAICERGGDLSVERTDQWEDVGWAAYAVIVTSTDADGCALVHHRVAVSIGIGAAGPRYRLRSPLPDERTRVGDCELPSTWRTEAIVDGDRSAVRLVSVEDHAGDQVARHLVVRRATAEGWFDQLLVDPAPPRVADPSAAGPIARLAHTRSGETWVVLSGDRGGSPCVRRGGQVVWRWSDGAWVRSQGREALELLTAEGLWRYAGDDGYMLILAQDDERDSELLEPRLRRLQRAGVREDLLLLDSSDFPKLNPGFWVITPAPWPTEREARAAKSAWNVPAAYVKRAWSALDVCATP